MLSKVTVTHISAAGIQKATLIHRILAAALPGITAAELAEAATQQQVKVTVTEISQGALGSHPPARTWTAKVSAVHEQPLLQMVLEADREGGSLTDLPIVVQPHAGSPYRQLRGAPHIRLQPAHTPLNPRHDAYTIATVSDISMSDTQLKVLQLADQVHCIMTSACQAYAQADNRQDPILLYLTEIEDVRPGTGACTVALLPMQKAAAGILQTVGSVTLTSGRGTVTLSFESGAHPKLQHATALAVPYAGYTRPDIMLQLLQIIDAAAQQART
jgi:hypothetical protein